MCNLIKAFAARAMFAYTYFTFLRGTVGFSFLDARDKLCIIHLELFVNTNNALNVTCDWFDLITKERSSCNNYLKVFKRRPRVLPGVFGFMSFD